ncbi:hypothetical protein A3770_02p13690 [Chloropicon primus]|uniref:Uncharacterized protein n=2 Tax=Chloropicon primus TaxID=1764295 RepID=A0A5B8MEZ5_9CHLO|nr:hypothetical protein A3770_02p13690 [Chloropicon primus]|eukprot:QDZ18851.1 hypothetical protein A3770_02p13690 [Chloropicon primus]
MKGKRKSKGGAGGVDERFASAGFDPRFARFPGKKGKKARTKSREDDLVEVEERMEEDPRFATILKNDKRFAVGTSALKVDKRGRERQDRRGKGGDDAKGEKAKGAVVVEEEPASSTSSESDDGDLSDSGSSSFEDVIEEEEFKKKRLRAVERFGIGAFAGRYLDDDELEEVDLEGNTEYQKLVEGERCQLEDATRRVAVVDLAWDNFTACDILAVLRSFVPQGHNQSVSESVKRVTVYKSDYGMERMKIEDKQGPGVFFTSKVGASSSNSDDEGSDTDDSDSEGKEVDKDALRAYERSKLRYFFAIAEFSDKKIAKYIYDACDGLEFDRSSSRFDLRFVAEDDRVEDGRPVRDEAHDVPVGYSAPLDGGTFYNSAIQHTNVNLTWDQEDKKRRNTFKEQFQRFKKDDAVMDADIQAYLASDSSSGEESGSESEETRRAKFRSMLNLGDDGRSKKSGKVFGTRDWVAEEDKDVDMVVTFDSGIDDLGEKLKAKHERIKSGKGDLTVWEQKMQEKKEKKMMKKKKVEQEETEGHEEGDDDAFDDPFFNEVDPKGVETFDEPGDDTGSREERKKKGKKKNQGRSDEAQKAEAELDLLLTSDTHLKALSSGHKVYGMGEDNEEDEEGSRKKKSKKKKGRSSSGAAASENGGKGFEMNLEDPRFSKMYSSKEFALDPTEPQYKQLPETLVKKFHSKKKIPDRGRSGPASDGNKSGRHDLSAAVESLKRKLKGRSRN